MLLEDNRNGALDALFRHQLTDLLATRLLAAHTGSPSSFQPTTGGLSPKVLLRAIERLRSDSEADVSLAALASEAGLVALPLLPRLQGKHRALTACLAAPTPARAGHEHAARHRHFGRVSRRGAWLFLANRFRCGVQEADRRNPERLAKAHGLAAIALQIRQSLWGSRSSDPLDHRHGPHQTDGDGQ